MTGYDSAENIWSVLFTTGYLTQRGKPDGRNYHLAVPNREMRNGFWVRICQRRSVSGIHS